MSGCFSSSREETTLFDFSLVFAGPVRAQYNLYAHTLYTRDRLKSDFLPVSSPLFNRPFNVLAPNSSTLRFSPIFLFLSDDSTNDGWLFASVISNVNGWMDARESKKKNTRKKKRCAYLFCNRLIWTNTNFFFFRSKQDEEIVTLRIWLFGLFARQEDGGPRPYGIWLFGTL